MKRLCAGSVPARGCRAEGARAETARRGATNRPARRRFHSASLVAVAWTARSGAFVRSLRAMSFQPSSAVATSSIMALARGGPSAKYGAALRARSGSASGPSSDVQVAGSRALSVSRTGFRPQAGERRHLPPRSWGKPWLRMRSSRLPIIAQETIRLQSPCRSLQAHWSLSSPRLGVAGLSEAVEREPGRTHRLRRTRPS